MSATTRSTLTPALLRSLRTLDSLYPRRTVPEGSPTYRKLHDLGYVEIIGTRYGHGCGRHAQPLWEIVLTDAGRAVLSATETTSDPVSVAPYGPVTSTIYGKQDMGAFFAAAAAALAGECCPWQPDEAAMLATDRAYDDTQLGATDGE